MAGGGGGVTGEGEGVINVGVIARGQGKGSLSRSCGNQLRHGVRGGPACLRRKQMFSPGGVPSLRSNLQRLGGQVLNRGGGGRVRDILEADASTLIQQHINYSGGP